ncbi:MAG: type pilus biosis/stability protein PilW [Pseudomonadota bacterium]|jgi:type IV pilus assembly protein PilF
MNNQGLMSFSHAPRRAGWCRWLALFILTLLSLFAQFSLSGCAGQTTATRSSDLLTESDEPDARKRARLRLELAGGYFEQGQTEVALDEIKQSLAADPRYGPAYVLRGLVYMRMNDNRQAEDSFQRALQINPRDTDALHNYGWFACQQGRHTEALELFGRALSNPTYGGQAKTYMTQGICQLRMGQLAQAETSFARTYELDPSNPVAGYNLAALLFRRGEHVKAQFYIRRLNNSELSNAETLWLGIRLERQLGNHEVVQQLAQQLGRRYPQSREWDLYQRGAFYE